MEGSVTGRAYSAGNALVSNHPAAIRLPRLQHGNELSYVRHSSSLQKGVQTNRCYLIIKMNNDG